jgi:hypothetical protein
MRKTARNERARTPIRAALRADSRLQPHVQDGLGALAKDSDVLHERLRQDFGDSLDTDTALKSAHPKEHRWDYLLGHTPSRKLIGVECHSANTSEVSVIIAKKRAAESQLRPHLRNGVFVSCWYWVASGTVQIHDLDKARRRLDQAGIELVGRRVLAKHLPMSEASR